MSSYYEDLGVPETATGEDIRRAYLRLSLETHPDKNLGDVEAAEEFKVVGKAYEVLADPVLKAKYDQELNSSRKPRTRASTSAAAEEDRQDAISRQRCFQNGCELRTMELIAIVRGVSIPDQIRRKKDAAEKRKLQALRRAKQRAEEREAWLFVKFGIRPFRILIPRLFT
jgi:curved DNA-binding protein CbpA